ncbi:CDP-alcohol phosphatidyltransferase family protein [Microtetraspora sp. AC03309]|uniref:CDP-alcohol phosphatidyltransferase family protein n=1 Tax=Microtetraspora sp. AC03309 TaxID=2779376 RepID=UPI001E462359|nr:CDP-alcohol phosphatidyltransferase family protein [Microtetraspora sp. AC03309]
MGSFTLDDVLAVRKPRDSWWTVFLVDPIACRLALLVANHTSITPNGLTRLSMVLGLTSAVCFAQELLIAGAVLFFVSFTVDCMDGKIARLKGNGTPFGLWLDYVGDRIRVLCCAFGIASALYARTGDLVYVVAGAAIVVLDLFRYINGPQLKRVRDCTRAAARESAGAECVFMDELLGAAPGSSTEQVRRDFERVGDEDGRALVDLQRGFRAQFPWYDRVRMFLVAHRVRSHVISGIEFHAAVFVIGPVLGAVGWLWSSAVTGALLLAFECVLVYRAWLATREVTRAVPVREREKVLV